MEIKPWLFSVERQVCKCATRRFSSGGYNPHSTGVDCATPQIIGGTKSGSLTGRTVGGSARSGRALAASTDTIAESGMREKREVQLEETLVKVWPAFKSVAVLSANSSEEFP